MILDYMLGEPLATIYSSKQMVQLLEVHKKNDALDPEQAKIMSGGLNFHSMSVGEVMTPLDRLFMLEESQVLDMALMKKIFNEGYVGFGFGFEFTVIMCIYLFLLMKLGLPFILHVQARVAP